MMKRTYCLVILLLPLITAGAMIAGCAPVFPKEALDRVDRRVTFRELQSDPDKFKGVWVMLAGVIIDSRNVKDGTDMEILQKPMDRDGRPLDTDATEGRFLVQTDQFLDPAVYHQGRYITVIGEVVGKEIKPIDEVMYQYPVLTAKNLRLWRPSYGPRFFFGVGVSGRM